MSSASGAFGGSNFSVLGTYTYANYSVDILAFSWLFNGAVSTNIVENGLGSSTDISGPRLSVVFNGDHDIVWNNFDHFRDVNVFDTYTSNYQGTLTGSTLEDSVDYETITSFTGELGGDIDSGSMLITGNNSSLLVTALGGDSVRLDVDTNADGDIDIVIDTLWSSL